MGNTGATAIASASQVSICIVQAIALSPNVSRQRMRWPIDIGFPCVCTLSSWLLLLCHPWNSHVERTLCLYRSGMKFSLMVCTTRPPSRARRVLSPHLIPATPFNTLAPSGLRTSASMSAMLACPQRNPRCAATNFQKLSKLECIAVPGKYWPRRLSYAGQGAYHVEG